MRPAFRFAGSNVNFWPYLAPHWSESFRGWRCLERCLQQRAFDVYAKVAGPQRWTLFPLENCPWERMLTVAMREAGRTLGTHRLAGSTLYVTLEPCAMCAMAMVHARIARLVYGATDPKTGAAGSVFDLLADPRHNHRIDVAGGVLGDEAGTRLTNYFRAKRGKAPL